VGGKTGTMETETRRNGSNTDESDTDGSNTDGHRKTGPLISKLASARMCRHRVVVFRSLLLSFVLCRHYRVVPIARAVLPPSLLPSGFSASVRIASVCIASVCIASVCIASVSIASVPFASVSTGPVVLPPPKPRFRPCPGPQLPFRDEPYTPCDRYHGLLEPPDIP
jgi:hypothetical protein